MLKRVVMKKFLSAILILLSMTLLMADSPALTISEGNIDDVELFAPDGTSLSVLSDITESGFIIRTSGETKTFTSPFGDVYLQGDSVLAITGFTTEDPTLYLVYGQANIVLNEDFPLTIYTPTSRTAIEGKGEYAFISTDSEEAFMNYSSSNAVAYDAMRARNFDVLSMQELSYAEGTVKAATQKSYYDTTVLADLIIYDAAEEEPEAELPAEETPSETPDDEPAIPAYEAEEEIEEETIPAIPVETSEEEEETPAYEVTVPSEPVLIEPVTSIEGYDAAPAEPVEAIESEAAIPSAPVFEGNHRVLETPASPSFASVTATLVPSAPSIAATGTKLTEDASVPEAPSAITSTAEISAKETEEEHLIKLGIELGASYPLNWNKAKEDGTPLLLVTPSVTIGRGNWQIGLRAPLQMAFTNGPFRLVGFSGKEPWNFGVDKSYTKEEAIYNAITDSMTLIDHLYLGNPDYTVAYLRMERGYDRNGTIFSNYGWDEGLAVRLGFNFPNLSFQVYLDNAEAPHVGEFGVSFYPFAFRGTAFSINVPMEFLFTDNFRDYNVFFFPEIRLDIPFAERSFILSVFASGTMYTEYNENELTRSEIIYDFGNSRMLPFMAGAELTFDFKPVKVEISGGYRNGLSQEYFNEFAAAEHRTSDFASFINDDAFFASAALTLDFDVVKVGLSYSVDDIEGFRNSNPQDIARIRIEADAADIADIYATAAVRNLVSSFKDFNTKAFLDTNLLFAVGVDLDFGMFGLTAEARTVHIPAGSSSFLNVHDLSSDTYLQLKLLGRVEFGWL